MKVFINFIACVNCLILVGCGASLFAHRDTNPSIQDISVAPHFWPWSKMGINTFSTTASRRIVLVRSNDYGDTMTSCSEPSPDVGEAFVSAVSDALKLAASEPKSGINATLMNEYARAAMTQITPLIFRTQSLQLYRDAIYSHCIDYMNGWYTNGSNDRDDTNLNIPISLSLMKPTQEDSEADNNNLNNSYSEQQPSNRVLSINPSDYHTMKFVYFLGALEALKVELPLVIKAQEKFAENLKSTGITDQSLKALAELTKKLSPTTITSTTSGTTIVTGPNMTHKEPTDNQVEK